MADRPFVHLHCHTHYSLLDGASRVPELVAQAKGLGMNALAMTDHGNLYGAIEFYQRMQGRRASIRSSATRPTSPPTQRTDREPRSSAARPATTSRCWPRTSTGFKNLVKLASIAYLEGYHYVPRIDKELLAAHSEGIICL